MTDFVERLKGHVDVAFDNPRLRGALAAPEIFEGKDQQATPDLLQEWAQYVASQREYVAEVLQSIKHTEALVTSMYETIESEHQDQLDVKLAEDAPVLLNRGFAMAERMAHAKVSLADDTVRVRAAKLQVDRIKATARELEHVHREWRNAEFTIDRMIRLTQLRLQLSEV